MKPREGTKEETAQDKLQIMLRLIEADPILRKLLMDIFKDNLNPGGEQAK